MYFNRRHCRCADSWLAFLVSRHGRLVLLFRFDVLRRSCDPGFPPIRHIAVEDFSVYWRIWVDYLLVGDFRHGGMTFLGFSGLPVVKLSLSIQGPAGCGWRLFGRNLRSSRCAHGGSSRVRADGFR
jgi:hypothetical protein